jgi:hypothetical protein
VSDNDVANGEQSNDQGKWGLRLPILFARQQEIFLCLALLEDEALKYRAKDVTCAGAIRAVRKRVSEDWEIPDRWVAIIIEKGIFYSWPPFEEE